MLSPIRVFLSDLNTAARWGVYIGVVLLLIVGGIVGGLAVTPVVTDITPPDLDPSVAADMANNPQETIDTVQSTPRRTIPIEHNPWGRSKIPIAVTPPDTTAPQTQNYTHMAVEATEYWNENMSQLGYTGTFTVVNETATDRSIAVQIVFVDSLNVCGVEEGDSDGDIVGCAPKYTGIGSAITKEQPTKIRIETGYRHDATVDTIIHELGHTLSLGHADADRWPEMAAKTAHPTLPKPNVTAQANPWVDDTIGVEYGPRLRNNSAAVAQLDRMLDYYNSGARGFTPEGVRFTRVNQTSPPAVSIKLNSSLSTPSTAVWHGYDPDSDGALESHTTGTVSMHPVVTEHAGWYAGYWLGAGFGIEKAAELPPPFDNPQTADKAHFSSPG